MKLPLFVGVRKSLCILFKVINLAIYERISRYFLDELILVIYLNVYFSSMRDSSRDELLICGVGDSTAALIMTSFPWVLEPEIGFMLLKRSYRRNKGLLMIFIIFKIFKKNYVLYIISDLHK